MLRTIAAFDRIGEENAFAVLARANALVAKSCAATVACSGDVSFHTIVPSGSFVFLAFRAWSVTRHAMPWVP